MEITRIDRDGLSRVVPALNPRWDDLTKLRWWAAVASHDGGLEINVDPSQTGQWKKDWRGRMRWITRQGAYDVIVIGGARGPLSFEEAKATIHGICMGATAARRPGS